MDSYDISRVGFDPRKHYSSVRMQQGRVQLDSDWNEDESIDNQESQQTNIDVIGSFGTPDNGFHISNFRLNNNLVDFDIEAGTLYLGGLRLEMDKVDNGSGPVFETYRLQRDLLEQQPMIDQIPDTNLTAARYDLIYLEAWQQGVCAVEDSELFEEALAGFDTSYRIRNQRRVRIKQNVLFDECPKAWQKLIDDLHNDHKGTIIDNELVTDVKLKVTFRQNSEPENLCSPNLTSGYLGADNQAIRVQLVSGNQLTWGFNNAAPLYRVKVTGTQVTFKTEPKDQFHWPLAGQTVEILPWSSLLPNYEKIAEINGFLVKIKSSYDPETKEIVLAQPIPISALFGNAWKNRSDKPKICDDPKDEYYYMRIWDRGPDIQSHALIPFVPNTALPLGNTGLEVTITGTNFNAGDYWVIAARPDNTDTAQPNTTDRVIPWILMDGAKPHGIRRYFAPLAIIHWYKSEATVLGEILHDCRKKFRPLTDQEGCCTYTVGDRKISHGDFSSIEEAVANLPVTGGKICVLPGEHEANLELFDRSQIWISGCEEGRTIVRPRKRNLYDPIITIEQSSKIKISGFSLVALGGIAILIRETRKSESPSHDITISDNQFVAYENAIKIMPDLNINITKINISHNTISMVDRQYGGAAIFSVADDVVIEKNDIVVYPQNTPGIMPAPGNQMDPFPIIFNPCRDLNDSYQLNFPLKSVLKMAMKYSTGINAIHLFQKYQTLGGIQIGCSSERVRIKENKIIGGSGNGITLGHLPEFIDYPDPVTDHAVISDEKKRKLYFYRKTVVTESLPTGIIEQFDNEFLSSLYDIIIEENQIRLMGLSGIGVVTFFDIKVIEKMIIVNDLTIYRNSITECAKQVPWEEVGKISDDIGFGGISLSQCTNAIIRENRIEDNGNNDSEPICGIFAALGEKIDVSGNRILNNGLLTATLNEKITIGNRAGVFIKHASKQFNDYSAGNIQLSYFDGLPAVNIHDNFVTQPLGQALFLVALGPVSVVGNVLTSQGTHPLNPSSLIAGSVFIQDLGISKDLLTSRNIPCFRNMALTSTPYYRGILMEVPENDKLAIQWQYLPGGNILYNDNQTTLDLRRSQAEKCFCSQMMISLDDISFNCNQSDVMSHEDPGNGIMYGHYENGKVVYDMAVDTAILNVFLAGFSIRTNSSRFQEGNTESMYSLLSLAYMNTAVGNQATHCLLVFGNRRVNHENIVLHDSLCEASHEKIINHAGLQPATRDKFIQHKK